MTTSWSQRRAFTLIEVVVTLAVLGLVLGMSAVSLASLAPSPAATDLRQLDSARRAAIQTGAAVRLQSQDGKRQWLFLPDGRGVGSDIDLLTGTPLRVAH